jgi:hypothetical protein
LFAGDTASLKGESVIVKMVNDYVDSLSPKLGLHGEPFHSVSVLQAG